MRAGQKDLTRRAQAHHNSLIFHDHSKTGFKITGLSILALPAHLCQPVLTEEAVFCLETAQKQADRIDEVWILGQRGNAPPAPGRWFENAKVRCLDLDAKLYPPDIGNNQYLHTPICLYQALVCENVSRLITPLCAGSAYFVLMAREGGLLPETLHIEQTCYLPSRLAIPASLVLPQHLEQVVDSELERQCARRGETLWTGHETLIPALCETFDIQASKIKSLPLKTTTAVQSPPGRHLVFAGELNPVYGFDAFLDLAETLSRDQGGRPEKISVFFTGNRRDQLWQKDGYKRLKALDVDLDWQRNRDFHAYRDRLKSAILIAPMRAPVLPLAARSALAAGIHTIWGTGFEQLPRSDTPHLHTTISDVRKLAHSLRTLWGSSPNEDSAQPGRIKTATRRNTKKPASRPTPVKTLSVVVIHHNRPDMLDEMLGSLAAQTEKDFELVIVDDGSRPEHRDKLPKLALKHGFETACISLIENSYPSAARNHGAGLASGDAVFFMDDDNLLAPETLAAFKSALQKTDIVLSFYQTFSGPPPALTSSGTHRPKHLSPAYGFAGLLPGTALFYNLVGNSALMMRREDFLARGGFSPLYGVGLEDYAFLAKCAVKGDMDFTVLPEPYLHFRLQNEKIRASHVDWRAPVRLQAGHWRLIRDLANETGLPAMALAYARGLQELTSNQFIARPRPKYFRLRSVLLHQYLRPFLSRHKGLRKLVIGFAGKESRFYRLLERIFH